MLDCNNLATIKSIFYIPVAMCQSDRFTCVSEVRKFEIKVQL